jgi:type VI secretion system protein ImpA
MAEKVGAHQTVTFEDLTGPLQQMVRVLGERLGRRAVTADSAGANGHGDGSSHATSGEAGPISDAMTRAGSEGYGGVAGPMAAAANDSSRSAGGAPFVAGEIRSRAEVIRALEALCGYYDRHEPSSPVPMLLRRAQRLVHMSFMDIMKDLAPDAMSDIEKIRGPEEPQN